MKEKIGSLIFAAALLALGLAFNSCGGKKSDTPSNGDEISGRISLSGAFALYPLAVKWAEDFQKLHPKVKIEVDGGGAGKGMTDVLTGQVELGMVSREVSSEEAEKGAVGFAVAKDAVVPTINEKNPHYTELVKRGITLKDAQAIWLNGSIKSWSQLVPSAKESIALFTRSDACGAAETWANWLGKHQEDLLGEGVHGLDVNGNGKIDADEDFYATKDQITKAIAEGKYPSPPARDLYLVAKGIPTNPVVVAFLKYVLTEGQKVNASVGYISIPQDKLDNSLQKLK